MKEEKIPVKKKVLISVIVAILVVAIIIGVIFITKNDKEEESGIKLGTEQEMKDLINKIYGNLEGKLPELQMLEVNKEDSASISQFTGLKSANNIENLIVSEPMMSSQAYSLTMLKVSKNADIEAMKQEMIDNIDTRKWICVEAEKVYVTNYKDVILLVMSSDEWATPVYNEFKNIVGDNIGKELTKTAEM